MTYFEVVILGCKGQGWHRSKAGQAVVGQMFYVSVTELWELGSLQEIL
jgi:hypothetical protein